MPPVYWGAGCFLWRHDRRASHLDQYDLCFGWCDLVHTASAALRSKFFSTYNGIGVVTIEGVIDADPDVRDTYINLRATAEGLWQRGEVLRDFLYWLNNTPDLIRCKN